MHRVRRVSVVFLALASVFLAVPAAAHPGAVDSRGGHLCDTDSAQEGLCSPPGSYHCMTQACFNRSGGASGPSETPTSVPTAPPGAPLAPSGSFGAPPAAPPFVPPAQVPIDGRSRPTERAPSGSEAGREGEGGAQWVLGVGVGAGVAVLALVTGALVVRRRRIPA